MNWTPPDKPAELTENRLIEAILDGTFPVDSNLPGERDFAEQLGITRPTLRTVLHRLARDGWVEIRHGKPTRVRNYMQEGTLAVLVGVAVHSKTIPDGFVSSLLDTRILLAPAYTRLAVQNEADQIASFLTASEFLGDSPEEYAAFDWELHRRLTIFSGNPVFTLFINSVQRLYELAGPPYYRFAEARALSLRFYQGLTQAARQDDPQAAADLSLEIMQESKNLWIRIFERQDSQERNHEGEQHVG